MFHTHFIDMFEPKKYVEFEYGSKPFHKPDPQPSFNAFLIGFATLATKIYSIKSTIKS